MPAGRFWRICPDAIELFEKKRKVKSGMIEGLPSSAGEEVRACTIEMLWTVVFRDWISNEDKTVPAAQDVADWESFVQGAAPQG